MSKYLRLFNKDSDYQSAVDAGEIEAPNVSYSVDTNTVHYNPIDKWFQFDVTPLDFIYKLK